jgi:hypothetical protein
VEEEHAMPGVFLFALFSGDCESGAPSVNTGRREILSMNYCESVVYRI